MSDLNSLPQGCVEACPACPHRLMSREESLLQKENWLKRKLGKYSSLVEIVRSVSDDKRWGYRDKVCLTAEFLSKYITFGSIVVTGETIGYCIE